MLKLKYLTLFKPKNWKRAGILTKVARKIDTPPQEESKSENAQFLQWILKDDDVYFQKITAS